VIFIGIVWQRHEEGLTARMRALLPSPLQELIARGH